MFGGHGHSHGNGQQCNHNHGGGSGGSGASRLNVGFDDEEEEEIKQKRQTKMQNLNMQQMMMANAKDQMAASDGSERKVGGMIPALPMMMHGGMMPKMNPKMMEISKKVMEQRQQIMKEFIEKGGESNPEAMQEMMRKAQELQRSAMLQMQEAMAEGASETQTTSSDDSTSIPMSSVTGTNLLNADLNNSKLDDLINPSNLKKKKIAKNEEEAKILDSISRKDYSSLTAVKATQYGILERLKELIESGQTDPHKPDAENVYLLHWAAINNRIEIAKYLLSLKVSIDPIGGELESTPLNWAARSGHIQMVVFLVQNGANPMMFDIEGFSTIHLSTMFGHSIVTAYLLAKGLDPDMKDKNGVTPLMFAAQRIHSRDPAQLLLTFSARMNVQDNKGNTPLHYCVAFNNVTVMKILLEKGASLDIKNHKGLDPVEFAIDRGKGSAASLMRMSRDEDKNSLPRFLRSIGRNKEMRKQGTRLYPFLLIFYFGMVFDASVSLYLKLILMAMFYGVSFSFNKIFFDKNVLDIIPFATTCAIIFWCYVTYILHFFPVIFRFDLAQMFFWFSTGMSWYCLYKCFKTDPGVLTSNHEQMNQTIIKFVEQDAFSLDQFCTVCIIRKPLRSKHCSSCDRCVAKFDHHCPWVDNCVGQNNLKYFLGFVFWTPICLVHFLWGAFKWYETKCYQTDMVAYPEMSSFRLFVNFVYCSPWVSWITAIVCLNTFWISCLCICHIYQIIFAGLTTNERLNAARYKHFYDDNDNWKNPYNFGPIQNFVDLLEMQLFIFKPTFINWKKEYNIEDIKNLRTNRIKRTKAENQIV